MPAAPNNGVVSRTDEERRVKKAFGRGGCVRALLCAPARSAKSTLGNWLASVLSGSREAAFAAGGGESCDQHTQGPQVWAMFKQFGFGTGLDGSDKELVVIDDKGFVEALALRCVLSGRVRPGEVLDAASPQYAAMLSRAPDRDLMPTVAIVPIRATALLDPETEANAKYLKQVREILGVLNHFNPNGVGGAGPAYQVQAVPVITCLDKLSFFDGLTPACLRERGEDATGPGAEAMRRVEAAVIAAGLDAAAAVYLGWLHVSPPRGEFLPSDARVEAVWELIERVVRFGTSAAAQALRAGWDLAAVPADATC